MCLCGGYEQVSIDIHGIQKSTCASWSRTYRHWKLLMELDLGPLEGQHVLLIVEPFLSASLSVSFGASIPCSPGWPRNGYVAEEALEFLILLLFKN